MMRSTTLIRVVRIALLMAGLAVLPQFASAQLPIETKTLKLQATGTSSTAVTLSATGVSANYTLNFPATQGTPGGFLYLLNTGGDLAFASTTGLVSGSTPVWDGTNIVWEDPSGANNPNWSRTGNAITAGTTGTLGTTTGAGIDIKTNNDTRIAIASDGTITIDETTSITGATTVVGATSINAAGTAATNIGTAGGDVSIGGSGSEITTTGSLAHTGSLALTGGNSPLIAVGTDGTTASEGTAGDVLVSNGAGNTPQWQSLAEATGIRATGKLSPSGVTSVSATGLSTIEADDKILITVEGASGVVAQVTAITAGTGFTVSFSGTFTGTVHYLVLD